MQNCDPKYFQATDPTLYKNFTNLLYPNATLQSYLLALGIDGVKLEETTSLHAEKAKEAIYSDGSVAVCDSNLRSQIEEANKVSSIYSSMKLFRSIQHTKYPYDF